MRTHWKVRSRAPGSPGYQGTRKSGIKSSESCGRTRAGVKAARGGGAKFGRKPRLSRQQIDHAWKMIDAGERREGVAALLNVDRTTLCRALCG